MISNSFQTNQLKNRPSRQVDKARIARRTVFAKVSSQNIRIAGRACVICDREIGKIIEDIRARGTCAVGDVGGAIHRRILGVVENVEHFTSCTFIIRSTAASSSTCADTSFTNPTGQIMYNKTKVDSLDKLLSDFIYSPGVSSFPQ